VGDAADDAERRADWEREEYGLSGLSTRKETRVGNLWVILDQTVTASRDPHQFFSKDGEVFVIAAKRVSGGDDSHVCRRLVGTGSTRAAARRSLDDAFSRHDPSGTIVPPTDA
jgi:hypothetical protein